MFLLDPRQFILVEFKHVPEGKDALRTFMESRGYRMRLETIYDFLLERVGQ